MPVVLGKSPNPHQTQKFARLLLTINRSELRITLRQIPVAARFAFVNLDVHGAVHRFQKKLPLVDLDRIVDTVRVIRIVS